MVFNNRCRLGLDECSVNRICVKYPGCRTYLGYLQPSGHVSCSLSDLFSERLRLLSQCIVVRPLFQSRLRYRRTRKPGVVLRFTAKSDRTLRGFRICVYIHADELLKDNMEHSDGEEILISGLESFILIFPLKSPSQTFLSVLRRQTPPQLLSSASTIITRCPCLLPATSTVVTTAATGPSSSPRVTSRHKPRNNSYLDHLSFMTTLT